MAARRPGSCGGRPWLVVGGPPAGEAVRPEGDEPLLPASQHGGQPEEVEEEVQRPLIIRGARSPSAAEVQEHEDQGHVQYRSWCRICVGARGTGSQHRTRQGDLAASADADPVVAADYCFFSAKGRDEGESSPTSTVLVL